MDRRGGVKNKTPAPIQITAEQLLREAWDHHRPPPPEVSTVRFADVAELEEHQGHERRKYEDRLMRNRMHRGLWLQYARWEAGQHNVEHARSVFERALDVDPRHWPFWIAYAEFEMGLKMVAHARNVFGRAVAVLPRKMDIWLKFAYMEEVLGNVKAARRVFLRAVEWRLPVRFYAAYVGFEERHARDEADRDGEGVGAALRRWCQDWPGGDVYERLARWEMKRDNLFKARIVYEEAVRRVKPPTELKPQFYRDFARFEAEKCKEKDRAAMIVKYAKTVHPDMDIGGWWKGQGELSAEPGWVGKRRKEFEQKVDETPWDWSEWHSWMTLEEEVVRGGLSDRFLQTEDARVKIDDLFSKFKNVKLGNEQTKMIKKSQDRLDKESWWPYAYLWVRYAIFLENTGAVLEASNIYQECLERMSAGKMGGHMFGKIWVLGAEIEIRKGNLDKARKILGTALGHFRKLGKTSRGVYDRYVELELALGEIDRARKIFEKWVESVGSRDLEAKDRIPKEAETLIKWAKMEEELSEYDRARALYELALKLFTVADENEEKRGAITLNNGDMEAAESRSELAVWRTYIDFEMGQKVSTVRDLYERLLERYPKAYVWRSYGEFASRHFDMGKARKVWSEGDDSIRSQMIDAAGREDPTQLREERVVLLEAWKEWEMSLDKNAAKIRDVEARLPKKVKRKRMLADQSGWEEYWDYIWLDEGVSVKEKGAITGDLTEGMGILAAAHRWKKQKLDRKSDKDGGKDGSIGMDTGNLTEGRFPGELGTSDKVVEEHKKEAHPANQGIFAAARRWKKQKTAESATDRINCGNADD